MCIHLKIYIIIFDSFCVFFLEHFDFFKMLLLLSAMFDTVFAKTQNFHFHDQIKQKTDNKLHVLLSENKKPIWKLFKPNNPKGQLSFFEVVYNIDYTFQNTLLDHMSYTPQYKLASVFTP